MIAVDMFESEPVADANGADCKGFVEIKALLPLPHGLRESAACPYHGIFPLKWNVIGWPGAWRPRASAALFARACVFICLGLGCLGGGTSARTWSATIDKLSFGSPPSGR